MADSSASPPPLPNMVLPEEDVPTDAQAAAARAADASGAVPKQQQPAKVALPVISGIAVATSPGQWKHGVVQFEESGIRAKYLIVPEECRSGIDLLAVITKLWSLDMPRIVVDVNGGENHPRTWPQSLLHRDSANPNRLVQGQADAKADERFQAKAEEIVSGVLTACAECNSWLWYSSQGRGVYYDKGSNEFQLQGKTMLLSAAVRKHYREHPELPANLFITSHIKSLYDYNKFDQLATSLDKDVTTVVSYPDYSPFWFADTGVNVDVRNTDECDRKTLWEEAPQDRPRATTTLMADPATYIILFQSVQKRIVRDSLMDGLAGAGVVKTSLFMSGHSYLLETMKLLAGSHPMVVLKNTGGASDIFAAAMDCYQAATHGTDDKLGVSVEYPNLETKDGEPARFALPPSCMQDRIIIVDAQRDSTGQVIDKLVSAMSLVRDEETKGWDHHSMENRRLTQAWQTLVCFECHAWKYDVFSSCLDYATILVALLTSLALAIKVHCTTAVHEVCKEGAIWGSSLDEVCSFFVKYLPVLAGLVLGVNQVFMPRNKWSQLVKAANKVESMIYCYRTRVCEYKVRQDMLDAEQLHSRSKVVRDLFPTDDAQSPPAFGVVPTTKASAPRVWDARLADPLAAAAQAQQQQLALQPMRRVVFMTGLQDVQNELVLSGLQGTALTSSNSKSTERRLRALPRPVNTSPNTLTNGIGDSGAVGQVLRPDDGVRQLTADEYIALRLKPTLNRLERLAPRLSRTWSILQVILLLTSSTNAVLALLGYAEWTFMFVVLVASIDTVMKNEMLAMRLSAINLAISRLKNLQFWWSSLSAIERRFPERLERLVESCESLAHADMVWTPMLDKRSQIGMGQGQQDITVGTDNGAAAGVAGVAGASASGNNV